MPRQRRSPQLGWFIPAVLVSVAIAAGLWLALDVPPYYAWLAGSAVALFCLYGIDKQRAQGRGGRVPAIVLHGLALAGGFVGGWAGRTLFRHKTRKPMFAVVLTIATIGHLGAIFVI
jgi:uncharacterized membrane protein YsdA (DUF1294 family)